VPFILVVIITYNGESWIEPCLNSLAKSIQPVKIMIIDNASTDQTKTIIKSRFSHIPLIENKKNLGFGQANNIGLKTAVEQKANYVFLLNQDAYVYPDTLSELLSIHEQHPEYGIISPLQLNGSGEKLDNRFRQFISNNYSRSFLQKIENKDPERPESFPIRFVNAAAWFISRKCIKKTGLFHPLFYHYGEDNNYCSRTQYHGFKTGVVPHAFIRHDRDTTPKTMRSLETQIELVPLYILLDLRKNIILAYILTFWKLTGFAWKGITQRSKEIRRLTFKKLKWILKNIPITIKARRETKKPWIKEKK
jgi:GT2 family glycosyltransferase